MDIRLQQEEWEREYLSPYASLSSESAGRDREEREESRKESHEEEP